MPAPLVLSPQPCLDTQLVAIRAYLLLHSNPGNL